MNSQVEFIGKNWRDEFTWAYELNYRCKNFNFLNRMLFTASHDTY